ncbi:hypothetical protein [Devosia sp. CN2-171]|uniref:hypothetical protein n=1 Tax=Devosia sp. CN2-171 TaxID=3400909 RepID=UPI003BF7926C
MRAMLRLIAAVSVGLLCTLAAAADLDRAGIERRAEAAARYLVAVEGADGRFLYEFDFLASRFLPADNVVRQAGAGFVLNQFLAASGLSAFIEPAARAIGYYAAQSVAQGDGLMVSEDRTREGARAGGTALALLAELFHSRAIGRDFRPDLRLGWLKGLAAQQVPAGGIAQNVGETDEDSYATGETWLALAHYADLAAEEPALGPLLQRLEDRVMVKYLETPDNQFAHWGLMAAAQRLSTTGDARYLDFIASFVTDYVRNRMPANEMRGNRCAALEGLIAAAGALRQHGNDALTAEVLDKAVPGLTEALDLQLSGSQRLDFGPGRSYEDAKLANFAGAFLNGAYTLRTRIDSTQHCLSALLLYRELAEGARGWRM